MDEPLNLAALMLDAPEVYAVYMSGRIAGRAEGYADGWAAAEESMAALHRAAHRVVQAAARLPEVDPNAARARAAARWSA